MVSATGLGSLSPDPQPVTANPAALSLSACSGGAEISPCVPDACSGLRAHPYALGETLVEGDLAFVGNFDGHSECLLAGIACPAG